MNYSCSAYVRQRGKAWRDAPIESVTLNASMLVDRETVAVGAHSFTRRPAFRGLRIDGVECVRFRLGDGRTAAVTLTFASCAE